MDDQALLESLVDLIYRAMLDRAEWAVFLSKLADSLNGMLPMLLVHDAFARGSVAISVGYDAKAIGDFVDYYAERNVWIRGAAKKRLLTTGTVRTSHMTCSRRELIRSEWYAGWCKPLEISQAIGTTILKDATSMFNVSVMGDHRREFGQKQIELLEALMPHLQRALKVHVRINDMEARQRGLIDALDGLPFAVMLLTAGSRVLYMNREAERLVAAADGMAVDAAGISAARSSETSRLRALIGAAAETSARRGLNGGGTIRITRPSGRAALEVLVSPIRVGDVLPGIQRPAALLYISDPARRPRTSQAALRQLYGLTAAEARVAALSACGSSVGEMADTLGVSRNTVKTQLKRVFAKTDTTRQSELIRLLIGGVAAANTSSRLIADSDLSHSS